MIMTKEFIDFMQKAGSDTQKSVYNFAIYTFCSLGLWSRIVTAFEIIMGKKFCVHISKNQVSDVIKETDNEDIPSPVSIWGSVAMDDLRDYVRKCVKKADMEKKNKEKSILNDKTFMKLLKEAYDPSERKK